ncbi:hypothetical protein BS78_04G023800 [Paspalum vaginatum]|nr:hypothetical protein BS78_04G023800 [Paspalum vaginatum]
MTSRHVRVTVGTGPAAARHSYYLKLDASTPIQWLNCEPCPEHPPQSGPVFNPSDSPTFSFLEGSKQQCVPKYGFEPAGAKCAFHLAGPGGLSVHGYAAHDDMHYEGHPPHKAILFACSHATRGFASEGVFAGAATLSRAPASLAMQAAARGLARFSYCLSSGETETGRHGFLRFGSDVPHNAQFQTTKMLPALGTTTTTGSASSSAYGYYVSLVGVSVGSRRLDMVRPEMFLRRKDDGEQGGAMIDLGTPVTVMVQDAYNAIEEAMWSDLERQGAERVKLPGHGLCVRATEAVKRRLQSLSLHFAGAEEKEATMVVSPEHLFWTTDDKQAGHIACLAMTPGRRTIIGAFQQVDTRFVFDLKDDKVSFAPESCSQEHTAPAV